MTAVTSNLGDGGLYARATTQRGTDLASATLSAPHLAVSWIGVTPDQRARLAVCLRDLADQLDALSAPHVDPGGLPVLPLSLGVDPIDGLGDTPLVSGADLPTRKDHAMSRMAVDLHMHAGDEPRFGLRHLTTATGRDFYALDVGTDSPGHDGLRVFFDPRHLSAAYDELRRVCDEMRATIDEAEAAEPTSEPDAFDAAEAGDLLPFETDNGEDEECADSIGPYMCSRSLGHFGQHVAQNTEGRVLAVRPTDAEAVAL